MVDEVEVLQGGVANAGAVVRIGEDVLRPAPWNSATIHRFLRHLARSGAVIAPGLGFKQRDDLVRLTHHLHADAELAGYFGISMLFQQVEAFAQGRVIGLQEGRVGFARRFHPHDLVADA